MISGTGENGDVGQRNLDRGQVLLGVPLAELAIVIQCPAPRPSRGVEGQAGAEGHGVGGQRRDRDPPGNCTRTGTIGELAAVPSPSCPYAPTPQA